MVTPDDARGLARVIDENPIGKSDKYLSEALRDLATQVESLQADADRLKKELENANKANESKTKDHS